MSPIVDVEGNYYPGAFRRRVLASPWWRLRFSFGILALYFAMQIFVVVYGSHQRSQVKQLLAETNQKIAEVQRLRPCPVVDPGEKVVALK